ncbi:Aste57867_10189 [Aphanomyces stellatus]|uniref:Aste57867_10189 protein n=1 Tax=Aphanomyces stellatus TaxID=120398 RepID=A0A485KQ73_9STRA|nr:hypothetical protein As57867_010150 [Aphanomyces stellatus]VFT87065.1 Aste57867_10189 [Aphanomyces stellatus]
MAAIPTVVVDDHHHVLEPIHKAIRKRILPFSNWNMVHFDAHPDLAFPRSIPADRIFAPFAFYDDLDESEAGIASFLLPLVYAGHMKNLVWVKPPWATQMLLGHEEFTVGRHDATGELRVSSQHTYFVDEVMYANPTELSKAQTLHLSVCELGSGSMPPAPADPYVLDICLDYFATINPFQKAFDAACGVEDGQLLRFIYGNLAFKTASSTLSHVEKREHQALHAAFLDRIIQGETPRFLSLTENAFLELATPLLPLYNGDPLTTRRHFASYYRMLQRYTDDQRALVQWAGPCVDLPAFENSNVVPMVEAMRTYLKASSGPPRMITIATSKADNYTPEDLVEPILKATLAMLSDVFGPLAVTTPNE